jgi:hypothetical protein
LRWPALLINVLMLVSVWTQGNHYFVDSLGGIAVAAMAIWIARAIVAVQATRFADAPTAAESL